MTIKIRGYSGAGDFHAISDFLIANYLPDNADGNWLQPRWEYMHFHPDIMRSIDAMKIGIWEDGGRIVAVAHPESHPGEVFLEIHPRYTGLKPEMLDYAEQHLCGADKQGRKFVHLFVYDTDAETLSIVKERGYQAREVTPYDFLSAYTIPAVFPAISLPEGFTLISLHNEYDPDKALRVLWRGFNHPGEPPADAVPLPESLRAAPNHRSDLDIAARAPNGDYAAYCGMWYVPAKRYAYVEPVATDPDYRLRGLARAAILEGVRRCGRLGAEVAYVTTGIPVYGQIGFRRVRSNHWWEKRW